MTSISASGTLYIKDAGGGVIQYSTDNVVWNSVITWPLTINNADAPNSTLLVLFTNDMTFNAGISQYFSCGTGYIQFGSISLRPDGTRPTIIISSIANYQGLINNSGGNAHISILNLIVDGTTSTLNTNCGWVAQQSFANSATSTNNYIVNCSSLGPISNSSGGILGSYSAFNGGKLEIIGCTSSGNMDFNAGGIVAASCCSGAGSTLDVKGCSSSGTIGINAGGIFGNSCGINGGTTNATYCYSTGAINGGGGIYGVTAGFAGSVTAGACYSTGSMTSGGGGIYCGNAALNSGSALAANCYSTGTIDNGCGGIYAGSYGAGAFASHCYTSGLSNGLSLSGIFSGSNNDNPLGYGISNYSQANNGNSGNWSDINADNTLVGTGIVWLSIVINQPYVLNTMGSSPYTLANIDLTAAVYSLVNTYTYPISVQAGDSTTAALVAGYTTFLLIGTVDPTIIINPDGSISTTAATPLGTYTLTIYADATYSTTTFIFNVIAAPTPPELGITIPPCCQTNITSERNSLTSVYESSLITNINDDRTIRTSINDLYSEILSGQRTTYSQPMFKSYHDYIRYLQGGNIN